jgi:integrase
MKKSGKKLAKVSGVGEMRDDKKKTWVTVARGVQVKLHPTRKHGKGPDKYFRIRYALNGEIVSESLGWASEGMTQEEAVSRRLRWVKARKGIIDGPASKAEEKQAEAEAKQAELDAKAQADAQAVIDAAKNITLREYWPEYLKAAKLNKKTKSWQAEDGYFRNWIDELLGHIPMREIGLVQWDGLMAALTDAGLAPRTRQYVALTLRQCLDHAFMRKLIPEAPPRAKHVGATLRPDSNRRTRTLSNQELQAILSALAERDQAAYAITLFCALTGCRFGEAAALQWQDVDFGRGECTFRKTKNGEDRTIPLLDSLLDFLRGMGPGKGLVFPNGNGTQYRQTPTPFRDAVDAMGLNDGRDKRDRVVFHTLRHTAATRLAQVNTPLPDLMALAGWKTASMALRYAHSNDAGRRRAMAALESLTQVEAPKVVELFGNGKK